MRWKVNDRSFLLVPVLALEDSWIMLCDHNKMLHHQFWTLTAFVSCRAFSPCCGRPLVAPTLALSFLSINSVAAITLGFCFVLVFHRETDIFILTVTSSPFAVNQGPRSCSIPLWRLVLLCLEIEYIHLCFIHICNFRLCG
jgi:hypothetical protein